MDLFNRPQLRRLAESQDDVCISLYMPTYRNESDWSQNTTRLKNLLREARNQLRDQDHREEYIDEILAEGRQLLDRPGFWRENIGDGLALFITADTTEAFRLPLTFDEIVIVEDRFHLKPLFPLIAANNRFYLLALNQSDIRVFQGTHQSVSEIERFDIPTNVVEAVREQTKSDQRPDAPDQRQAPTSDGQVPQPVGGEPSERQRPDLTGGPEDELKDIFRNVDARVDEYLSGEEIPLVLAGVPPYLQLYREVNSYPHLIDDQVATWDSDSLRPESLHEKAWSIVEPVFQEAERAELERFEQVYYQDEDMASDDFHEIIPGCAYSRVDTLFVPVGEHRWGRFDPESNTVEVHESQRPGDGDLLNYAAVSAYLNGATVHALKPEKMPGGRSVAATFRYRADVSASENG